MDLQKPELSNKTQRLLSCGQQTCSPGPCLPALPTMELIPGWGHGVPTQCGTAQSVGGGTLFPIVTLSGFSSRPLKPQTPLSGQAG